VIISVPDQISTKNTKSKALGYIKKNFINTVLHIISRNVLILPNMAAG
jgi:hypothetical protein